MKALKIIWMFCTIALLSACTTEDIIESSGSTGIDGEATTAIAISVDNLLPVNMNSRGTIDDLLSQVNDLNIRVTIKSSDNSKEKYTYIYCTSNGNITVDGKPVDSSKTYNIEGKMGYIHCNDISAVQVEKVQVIANYGSDLYNKNWESIVENDDENLLSQGYCMMFGETSPPNSNVHEGQGALNCQLFTVKLKRTRAMFTVALEGTGELKPGVSITPKKISLYNVPTQCSLLAENTAKDVAHKNGESHNIDWGTITSGVTVGTHADMNSDLPNNFLPLYLFENLGGETTNTDRITKYPEGCNSIEQAKKNKTHSYVEIEADYRYEEGGSLKNSGTIVYRFFLGENDLDDFNVRRNMYHRLTLRLKGFGGADEDGKVKDGKLVVNEEDLSWRVDMNVRDWGFEKSEYDFDAHDVINKVKVMGRNWKVEDVNIGGSGESWVEFATDDTGTGWTEPIKNDYKIGADGTITFHIQPMVYVPGVGNNSVDPAGFFDSNTLQDKYREMEIIIKNIDTEETQTIKVRQYVPIKFLVGGETFYMERFEEKGMLKWGWENKDLASSIKVPPSFELKSYTYGDNAKKTELNKNTLYLSTEQSDNAANYCYEKGNIPSGGHGAPVTYYVLPDKGIMEAMLKYNHNPANGPFEPIQKEENYWTSSVMSDAKTNTVYWNGQNFDTTAERNSLKRVRAVYTFDPAY